MIASALNTAFIKSAQLLLPGVVSKEADHKLPSMLVHWLPVRAVKTIADKIKLITH